MKELNTYQKICLSFMIFLLAYWIVLFLSGTRDSFYNLFYSFLFGLTPLFGGIITIYKAKIWGHFQSAIGKAVLFTGIGIFAWGFGELIWSYYNFFLNVPAPYPSLADIGFAPSIFFYGLGAAYLSKATGARFSLRKKYAKFFTTLAFILTSIIAYYLTVELARGGVIVPEGETPLKIILDIAYPLGDFLGLVVAVIVSGLSFGYLGGKYKYDIISVWLGLFVMYVADTVFSYTTSVGTFFNGNWGDLLLTTGLFFLTFGILGFAEYKSDE